VLKAKAGDTAQCFVCLVGFLFVCSQEGASRQLYEWPAAVAIALALIRTWRVLPTVGSPDGDRECVEADTGLQQDHLPAKRIQKIRQQSNLHS